MFFHIVTQIFILSVFILTKKPGCNRTPRNVKKRSDCAVVCFRVADDLLASQRKAFVVLGVVVVTVFGTLSGLMLGITILEHLSAASHHIDGDIALQGKQKIDSTMKF